MMTAQHIAKIFIVDDTPTNLSVLDSFLTDQKFEVFVATDGRDALQKISRVQPDLCLLDIIMPGMDGFETCRHLKSDETTQDIPVIFMTALTDTLDKVKGFEVGAVDYITKPLQQEEVLARINTHLTLSRLQKELRGTVKILEEQADELKTANRLKDEFLANMSHELRTPLNVILGNVEALEESVYGPLNEKQLNSLNMVRNSAKHLLQLINDILDISKISANKLLLKIKPISVQALCQTSLYMTQELAHKKQLHIAFVLDPAVEMIQADELRLKQILINLLSNAVKFTPEGGKIGLDVQGDDKQQIVHFTVWDTGVGIAEKDKANLFKAFVQLDGSLSRMQEGTGLGLFLVYRLTQMHGGSVSVTSEVGQGSRFTISLPWQFFEKSQVETRQGKFIQPLNARTPLNGNRLLGQ